MLKFEIKSIHKFEIVFVIFYIFFFINLYKLIIKINNYEENSAQKKKKSIFTSYPLSLISLFFSFYECMGENRRVIPQSK